MADDAQRKAERPPRDRVVDHERLAGHQKSYLSTVKGEAHEASAAILMESGPRTASNNSSIHPDADSRTMARTGVDPSRPAMSGASAVERRLYRERLVLLARLSRDLEPVMVVLSVAWIALVIADLVNQGLPPLLDVLLWVIWVLFVADFVVKLVVAPAKTAFLRTEWLTALSLVLPALRILRFASVFRVLRVTRVVRSVSLLRVATSVNRGLRALGRTASRRGAGYVAAATAIVIVVGAAGMAAFESPAALRGSGFAVVGNGGLTDYGEALWWTAYTMTTGATERPQTSEGRLLGWVLSVYGLAVFGYLTAILASHFVGQDRGPRDGPADPQAGSGR
ncbi:MAG: potassium channel family protein [Chloroflexi bacterium]|nr:potassium channel family protein [Chloroflexota bacterium]